MNDTNEKKDDAQNVTINKKGIAVAYKKLQKKYHQKSPIIRELSAQGFTRTQIKNTMNIRYQHVRNVLVTQLTSKK